MAYFLETTDVLPEAAVNVSCVRSAGLVQLRGDLDWRRVLEYAQIHGVLQFLAAAAARGDINPPAPFSDILTAQQQRNAVRALLQHRECSRMIDALAAAGIQAVPFKGTSLSKLLYRRVGDRISSDIDLLIPMSRLRSAQDVLQGLGYIAADSVSRLDSETLLSGGNELSLVNTEGVVVELHWRLFEVDRACRFPIELDELNLVGDHIGNEDLFLILAIHALTHHWEALKWVVDIDAFVRNVTVNWSVVSNRAAESGTLRAANIALLVAHDLFDTPLPVSIADRTARRLARRYVRCLMTNDRIPPLVDFWMQIAARERWIDRFRFFRFVRQLKPWDQTGGRFKTLSRVVRLITQSFRRSRLAEMQKIPELHRGPDTPRTRPSI